MPLFERADESIHRLMQKTMDEFHPGLRDAQVTVDCVMAHAKRDAEGQPLGPALKLHGVPAHAIAKILKLKDRAMGRADGEITIDGDRWDTWTAAQQKALLDHELEHFQLKLDREGGVVRDDLDRPSLKMKHHDWDFGWFTSIAQRHGPASFECQQAEQVFQKDGQFLFPFAAPGRREKAEKFLAAASGVESITLSGGGKSVTLPSHQKKHRAVRTHGHDAAEEAFGDQVADALAAAGVEVVNARGSK